jgi:hypothetical protein
MEPTADLASTEQAEEGLLEQVVRRSPRPLGEVTLGRLEAFAADGQAMVSYPESPTRQPLPARATLALGAAELGRQVALLFEAGDPSRPVIMGLLRPASDPGPGSQASTAPETLVPEAAPQPMGTLDGERLVFSAEKEIVLRCGQASITLTRAGKIILRGKYVLSRSSGVNRIKGGTVQIN